MSYKEYKTQEKNIIKELETLKKQSSIINKEIVKKKRELRILESKINKYKDKGVIITEHAIIRYLERFKKLDISEVKKEILGDTNLIKAIKTLDSGDFPFKGGIIRVKDKVIITVIKDE